MSENAQLELKRPWHPSDGGCPPPELAYRQVQLRILEDKASGAFVEGLSYKWDPRKKDYRQMTSKEFIEDLRQQSRRQQRSRAR